MKYFHKVCGDVADVVPIMAAISRHPELWDQNTIRTKYPNSPHAGVSDILLLFNVFEKDDPTKVINDLVTVPYPAWGLLPQVRPVVFNLMRLVEGMHLGRVMITKLPPGGRIPPHKDEGAPAQYFTRYQVALQSLPGALFTIEDETVCFRTGDIWMIDNKSTHSVQNNSTDDRIVMIADIRSA